MSELVRLLARLALALGAAWKVLVGVVFLGLRVRPKPFPALACEPPELRPVPIPQDLPPPVKAYYHAIAGESVPQMDSAVITGTADVRLVGVSLAGRYRFTLQAGRGYRHYIEVTLFGRPVFKVNERFLAGRAWLKLPFGVSEGQPKVDEAANLGLWAESVLMPAAFLTDSRVRWEPLDETHARLVVPAPEGEDTFTATFDPATGLLHALEAMRWKNQNSATKTLWRCTVMDWGSFHGVKVPKVMSVAWDRRRPWLVMRVDDIAYNADVSGYIKAVGP